MDRIFQWLGGSRSRSAKSGFRSDFEERMRIFNPFVEECLSIWSAGLISPLLFALLEKNHFFMKGNSVGEIQQKKPRNQYHNLSSLYQLLYLSPQE